LLKAAFQTRTTAEWLADLEPVGIPCGPLNSVPQAAAHPQVAAREMLVPVEHPRIGTLPLVNTPVKLSRTPGGIKGPSPSVGQHSADVLSALLGLSENEANRLIADGVVYTTDPATAPVIPH
jgi:CoA:oxalate CoA-transferase